MFSRVIKMYNETEVREIQDVISGARQLSDAEREAVIRQFNGTSIKRYLKPFVPLFATNPDLYAKVSVDERAINYSFLGFFPETFGLVYGSETSPDLTMDQGNRGYIFMLRHPKKSIVIKPVQSPREVSIAKTAGELAVGPRQYPTLPGYLTEELIAGTKFSALRGDEASPDKMYALGRRMGDVMASLHRNDIFYNDTILSDDFGRSHVVVSDDRPAVLFDYGVALKADNHLQFTDEEMFDYVRTFPGGQMLSHLGIDDETSKSMIATYRQQLKGITKDGILQRDIDFIMEGLFFGSVRIGIPITEPFIRGFNETYQR